MRVVAGLLESEFSPKHFLIGKRKSDAYHDHWEFPGGKKEQSEDGRWESDEDALRRELQEELGVHVSVCCEAARWSDPPNYPDFEIILYRVYLKKSSKHPMPQNDHSRLVFTELRSILIGDYSPATPSFLPLAQYVLEHTHD